MFFTPRLVKPEAGNKYYITKSKGGYSSAIIGKPTDPNCNVLANCVGYAFGRFHEICGDTSMHYLKPVNAELFIKHADKSLKVSQTPKLGAVAVWQCGSSSSADGAGHVAIVEKVISDTQIVTSESGYNSSAFWTQTRIKGANNNWGQKASYKFLGFICQPTELQSVLRRNDKGVEVKTLQESLNKAGYTLTVTSTFDIFTENAVKDLQKKYSLTVDGIYGNKTDEALRNAITDNIKPDGVKELKIILDGKEVSVWATSKMIADQNYVRLRDFETLGIVKSISYDSKKKMPVIKTR